MNTMRRTFILTCLLSLVFLTDLSASATKRKATIHQGSKAVALFQKAHTASAPITQPSGDGDEQKYGGITFDSDASLLQLDKGTPTKFFNHKGYKFGVRIEGLDSVVTSIEMGGKPVTYTEELHKRLKEGMDPQLYQAIENSALNPLN